MAEKNFKVLGLEVVGESTFLDSLNIAQSKTITFGGEDALDINGGILRVNQANYATEQYVTTAIGNISIPTQFITAIAPTSPFITVGQGTLDVNLGNGLENNQANNSLQLKLDSNGGFAYNEGRLKVKPWNGITVNDNGVAVNTSYVANAIAGSGLELANGQIAVDTDTIATKAYADSIAAGLDIKKAVHIATSENISLGNIIYAGNQYDGHTFAEGDRILVKDQTNSWENGIYVAGLQGPSRATDADSWAELNKGSFVFVESGTHAGHGFVVTTATTGETFGQQGSSIEFTQFSDAGNFITSVAQANGLSVDAGVLDLKLTGVLSVNQSNKVELKYGPEFFDGDGTLYLNYGNGLGLSNNVVGVNAEYVANAIAGSGLQVSNGQLALNTGNGLTQNNDAVFVDTAYIANVIAGNSLNYNGQTGELDVDTFGIYSAASGNGIYGSEGSINVNTFYVANALAGSGLTQSNGTLTIDYSTIASNLDGTGLKTEQGTLAINTTYVSMALQGTGLTYNSGNDTLGVDTQYIANTIAGSNLELSVIDNKLKLVDSPTIAGTLTVTGDLVVNGSTTTLNTTTLEVEDNLIVLNKNVTGTPLTNAGIEVERGNLTNASLYFDEEADQWKAHNGTSIITLGSSFITSIGQSSPFLDVTAGELTLAAGAGLTTNLANNHLDVDYVAVATQLAGSGLTIGGQNDTLEVLTSGAIYVNGSGKVAFNGSSIVGPGLAWDSVNETLGVNLYGETTKYDGATSNSSSGSSVVTMVGYASPNSNTYESVGTFPSSADAFEAFVTIRDEGGSKMRTSKLVGTLNTSTFEYTEFGIVEIGEPIANVDVDLYYDGSNNIYSLRVKGTGSEGNIKAVAEVKYITVA